MQALAITTDRGSLTFTGHRIQSSYLKKHSKPTVVCFSSFVSFPKSRLLLGSSSSQKQMVPVLVTPSSSSSSPSDDEDLGGDVLKNLSPAVRKRVEVLIEIENQYNELKEKFIEERSALEDNYLKLYQPLFTKRYEIVNGEEKGVSNFWLTVLKNNEITGKDITEQDEGALKYLKDIKWSILEGGFKLEFSFDQNNPYFKNKVLTKEYYTRDPYFNFFPWRTEGTRNIEWYPGKRLISELSTNYQDFVSFFNFFSPAQYGYWNLANKKDTKEDWRTGLTIKHKIISHAVSWFTGQNLALENLSPHVEVLREIQKQYDELEAKYLEERAALEAKYDKLYQPLYTKRYEIVNGVVEVEGVISEQGEDQEKGVPNFWLTVLKSNAYATYDINEQDKGALKYLKDIKWSRIEEEEAPNWWSMPEEPKWWKIEFFFDEKNPYFKNSVLTKRYYLIDGDIHYAFKKAIGTEIEWYPGNCLTTRTEEEEDFVSFFDFFGPLVSFFEFNRALAYKHEIIPLAVSLFLEPVPGEYSSHETDEDDLYEDDDDYWEEVFSKSTPIRSEATGV